MRDFTNLYQLSKTLRFELKPVGKTLENIQKSDLLTQDEIRAENYKKIKKIIDSYHKKFIEDSLKDFEFDKHYLSEYLKYFQIKNKTDNEKKSFAESQELLRKQVAEQFKNRSVNRLFGTELIKEDLPRFLTNEDDKNLIESFKNWITYFDGFHKNRKNMYSSEEKSTAIAYRIVHDNLPKFIRNMEVFKKVKTLIPDNITTLYKDLEDCMNFTAIDDYFKLENYGGIITQIQIEVYNAIIGGRVSEDKNIKTKGLNEYINLYNQQQSDKNKRLPKFIPIFKQILSDREKLSWLPEEFEDENKLLESVLKTYQEIDKGVLNKKDRNEYSLKELLLKIEEFDLSKIYLKHGATLTNISQKYLGHYSVIDNAIGRFFEQNNPQKTKGIDEKYEKRKEKYIKSFDSLSLKFIDDCVNDENKKIGDYFKALGKDDEKEDLFTEIHSNYKSIEMLLNSEYPKDKKLQNDKNNLKMLKQFLDSVKELQWFIKPLLGNGGEPDKDTNFYEQFQKLYEGLDKITLLYNRVRNFVTKKPYSIEKIKLNFENPTLLNGWDVNKEKNNTSIILKNGNVYYLAIMKKENNDILTDKNVYSSENCYEKMDYKLLPGANKMLPKVFFSKSRIDEFAPSETLLKNYANETHKKGEKFHLQHCHQLIDFFKKSIYKHEDWKNFNFKFSDTNTYRDLSEFYREVEQQGYKITFRKISENYINRLIDEGKLYLFQIYNKDFSQFSKGTPNMHTLYWKALFDAENLKNVVYKLNGEAEIFYRKRSISAVDRIVHKAKQAIDNKNVDNPNKQSVFDYEIIKDRRYTLDKFQFHCPITLNFKAIDNKDINEKVNQYIRGRNIQHVIGIDRGERHLLYLSLIDLKGNIVEQYSLNEIINEHKGNQYKTDYHKLLDSKEGGRDEARKNWKAIESIAQLKEGYLSQVIHKISKLIVENKAIVVLEDLNLGFMRGRQKVEKQVYQKFEKMLIDKLNYLVDKKKTSTENGGLLKAYQLTNKFESFQKMGKQNGFLFYIPAWNTSKIDPITGFVNLFDTRYTSKESAQQFFSKFADIRFNKDKKYFEFVVEKYSDFNPKAEGTRQNWIICSNDTRIETFRNPQKNNQWDNKEINLTADFKGLFDKYIIDFNVNLRQSILNQKEKEFFKSLLYLFKLTLQMRNSIIGTDTDYMISPVTDSNGNFFDSRKADKTLPQNADANGAYNIARKGLWIIEQIRNAQDLRKINLDVSNKEWLNFAQKDNQ